MHQENLPWSELVGGYGLPYDPRPALSAIERGDAVRWEELWENLHHQGDVGSASYVAVSEIARIIERHDSPDWNAYALVATIEEARLSGHNPPVPDWFQVQYSNAWIKILEFALNHLPQASDDVLIRSILAAIACAKGQVYLGKLAFYTEDELKELFENL
ncbi:MAG TPA: hypothetical protein VEZ24_02180 [Microvirga sp.]|nr:hypothetical protein [Microvirga sp.]